MILNTKLSRKKKINSGVYITNMDVSSIVIDNVACVIGTKSGRSFNGRIYSPLNMLEFHDLYDGNVFSDAARDGKFDIVKKLYDDQDDKYKGIGFRNALRKINYDLIDFFFDAGFKPEEKDYDVLPKKQKELVLRYIKLKNIV